MKKVLSIVLALCSAILLMGQVPNTPMPYLCGFEDNDDVSNWVLNPQSAFNADQWMIGPAMHCDGKHALYISDNGTDAKRGNKPNVSVAYMRVKFPTATKQKNYDLSFDYVCEGDANQSMLYVMVCPEMFFLNEYQGSEGYFVGNIVSASKGSLSKVVADQCEKFGPQKVAYLNGTTTWQNVSLSNEIRINSTNSTRTWVIAFIWVNNNTDSKSVKTGACIDNVQLGSATIKKPENLVVTPNCDDSTMDVSWTSASNYFVVEYRKVGSSTWRRADGITEGVEFYSKGNNNVHTYQLQRIFEGSYDVRVKSALISSTASDTSMYTVKNNTLMYCPYNHCINFLDLENPNLVCTYGYREGYKAGEDPYAHIGYVTDADPKKSRHTINLDPTEVDAQTDSLLKVIPDGAIGSVRLGNWNNGGEAESMTYTFTVDSAYAAILICRYAIVLQHPGDGCGDPGFKMEIFDENDNLLTDDDLCGIPDFTYSKAKGSDDWNEVMNSSGTDVDVVWKDWTFVGVNLQKYNGQNLKVRMTTYDCGAGGHYGYAYFTLDCANAHLETENCGGDARIQCDAPEGFAYKWTDELGNVVSNKRTLDVDPGMHTYTCRVSFIEDSTCYFEVQSVSAPRFPVPSFTAKHASSGCNNYIRFTNTSHVMNKYGGFENHTSEPCVDQHWYFTSLTTGQTTETVNYGPQYMVAPEGDSIRIRLTAYIGEANACDSTLDTVLYVPSILTTPVTDYMELCEGSPFLFDGMAEVAVRDSNYVKTYSNIAGCDSVYTLQLKVNPVTPEQWRVDSICSDSSITVGGISYRETGRYTVFLENQYHCDSIINIDLHVNPRINTWLVGDLPVTICSDENELVIDYWLLSGEYDSIQVVFDEAARATGYRDTTITVPSVTQIKIPSPAKIRPNYYMVKIKFYQWCCGVTTIEMPFQVYYYSGIIQQKWNDVLALLNENHNGGYVFTAYQWYKNGMPIDGATKPYLYRDLEEEATYYVSLTREDGVVINTCSVTKEPGHEDATKYPTLVRKAQRLPVRIAQPTMVRFVNSTGQIYGEQYLPEGDANIEVPSVMGVYVVQTFMDGQQPQTQYMIVQ